MGLSKRLATYAGSIYEELLKDHWCNNYCVFLKHILISGLRNLETANAREMAFQWAAKWVYTNYVGFNKTGSMFEKVNEKMNIYEDY